MCELCYQVTRVQVNEQFVEKIIIKTTGGQSWIAVCKTHHALLCTGTFTQCSLVTKVGTQRFMLHGESLPFMGLKGYSCSKIDLSQRRM